MQRTVFFRTRLIGLAITSLMVLSGCIDNYDQAPAETTLADDELLEVTITGSVGDGPIVGGTVTFYDAHGEIVSLKNSRRSSKNGPKSDDEANYYLKLNLSPSQFPITASVSDGTDLVTGMLPDFTLASAVMKKGGTSIANLNPFGTLAINIAGKMDGGLTPANLDLAIRTIHESQNFGLDSELIYNPIDTQVTKANAAAMVKASEAMSEVIRRTRDALIIAGQPIGADAILDAIGSDLVDGFLDGAGWAGVDPRVAAVANVASAQVLIESMTNHLYVNGIDATPFMDAAIQQITGGDTNVPVTDSVKIVAPMLTQARATLEAALKVSSTPELVALSEALEIAESDVLPANNLPLFPEGSSAALSDTILQVSAATDEELSVVNDSVRQSILLERVLAGIEPNQAPIINGNSPKHVTVGNEYDFTPTASDPDGDPLNFSISGMPPWANFDNGNGHLWGMPSEGDTGTYDEIVISTSDGVDGAALSAFSVTVEDIPNSAPTISGNAGEQVTVGNVYDFTPTASDADLDILTFTAVNVPAWANFDTSSGHLSGIPGIADIGSYAGIQINVSDGSDSASLAAFSITVNELPNQAPTISGTPATQVTVGNAYGFVPSASDADGDAINFTISGQPAWATFDAGSGSLSGIPDSADEGSYPGITISATDGRDTAALSTFTITVIGLPNQAPTINGAPAGQVTVGNPYDFTPTASDADGDVLSYAVAGLPDWASFDTSSGHVWGTPGVADVGSHAGIQISVTDGTDSASLPAFTIVVNGLPNQPPSINGVPAAQVTVGTVYDFTPTASDPEGAALSFSIGGQPAWANFDASTGHLWGTPDVADAGSYPGIQISVSDGSDSASLEAFTIAVIGLPNRAPTISGTPANAVTVGNAYDFTPTASDADGDVLNFSITGQPAWANFNIGSGRLWGTPNETDEGSYAGVQITVSDGSESASLPAFTITVDGLLNQPPTISGAPATQVTVGQAYDFTPTVSDADGDALSFSIVGQPGWANFDPASGRLSGTPNEADEGSYAGIRISVSDGRDTVTLGAFSITVNGLPNRVPTISGTPSTQVTVTQAYDFTPTASDADGDALSFSILGKPAWANFDTSTGHLWGTPDAGDEGRHNNIRIRVSDGSESASLPSFAITVNGLPNRAPTISGTPATQVTVGNAYDFTPTASDADGDTLSFSITGKPAWANFNSSSGQLSGTPAAADEGSYAGIQISVSDGSESASLSSFSITVAGLPNRAPTISGTPPTQVTAGNSYDFTPTASDADGDALSFSIAGQPSWANFDPASGHLWGIPSDADEGSYAGVRISVSDGSDTATLAAFTIAVLGLPNQPPTISGTPATLVNVDSAYDFMPTVSDPDGDPLSCSITGKPAWANFDSSSGRLWGAPGTDDEGSYSGIQISVSDGSESASLTAFTITVAGLPNQPPTISGTPNTQITVGNSYSFTPTASDPDNDQLSFSIAGLPAWASFDSSTGKLSGAPSNADEGSYSGIRISVSDGIDSASLVAFSITVLAVANQPPGISGTPSTQVTIGSEYDFTPTASDPDGDLVTFTIANQPDWASFDVNTGRLWGTPETNNGGPPVLTDTLMQLSMEEGSGTLVSDASGQGNDGTLVNGPVFAADTPDGSTYALRFDGADDSVELGTLDVAGTGLTLATWFKADSYPGGSRDPRLISKATTTQANDHVFMLSTIASGSATRLRGRLKVGGAITTLIASSGNLDTGVWHHAALTHDGTTLRLYLDGVQVGSTALSGVVDQNPSVSVAVGSQPPGAGGRHFDGLIDDARILQRALSPAELGTLLTTDNAGPGSTDEGSYPGIRISVSDGGDSASLPEFTITVVGLPNQPPTINGTPATQVGVGSAYDFTPTASDPDGDRLSFAITGKPVWANFNSNTGRLSGTPATGDEGTYTGIRISVSDGSDSASLADFDVTVVAQVTGSASLSWTAPTKNTDGTDLNDLAGFKVHYGPAVGNYPNVDTINNSTATTHLVENLVPGTWFFVVTALDSSENESAYSGYVSKVVSVP